MVCAEAVKDFSLYYLKLISKPGSQLAAAKPQAWLIVG